MSLDPRSVANLVIEEAIRRGTPVTNLSLQKIMYFIHGHFFAKTGRPLVSGHFEAWKYGPVHPLLYDSFRYAGSGALVEGAKKRDLMTGIVTDVERPDDAALSQWIVDTARGYFSLPPGRLIALSHARQSPWDILTRDRDGSRQYGLRITDDLLRERFKYHKIPVHDIRETGGPDEESPPDRN